MRIAFLADIHANLEALRACLTDAQSRSIDRYVYLGDIVGYGADPGACIDIVAEACDQGASALMGNHDQAVIKSAFKLNDAAQAAITWTQSKLGPEQKAFLTGLPLTVADGERLYVHASAQTPAAFPYIHSLREASDSLIATAAKLTVCGHVHDPALYHIAVTGKVMGFIPISGTPIPLSSQRRWLAVMGSVGQPRDGNPAAAYGILDTKTAEVTYLRVPYDIDGAAAKIRAAGLPDSLWKRLSVGR
jgi:diadenosine tetraphosphatase ApaH/serine/threonine PP2A family protein phosphatase